MHGVNEMQFTQLTVSLINKTYEKCLSIHLAKQNSIYMLLILDPSEITFYDIFCGTLNRYKLKAL